MSRKNRQRHMMGSDLKGEPRADPKVASPPSSPLKSPVSIAQSPPPDLPHPPRDHQRCKQELAEARLVASNLEKTVRWWAECTSKWRERWSRASAERNRAKKEVRALRQQLEKVGREAQELREELEEARKRQPAGTPDGERGRTPGALPSGEEASEAQTLACDSGNPRLLPQELTRESLPWQQGEEESSSEGGIRKTSTASNSETDGEETEHKTVEETHEGKKECKE
ncbi:coiled-coil domain-containing protein 102A-like isoform X2 [Rhinatrema bivittatum]|nr:coiled-coil domain-containing protein 102A-like isoform X2 [Rhinatrema bivittatum]